MACCPCCCTQQNGVCCGTGEEKVCCKAPRECCTVYTLGVGESDVCCTETQYCCNDGQGVCCEVGQICCVGDLGAVCCESNVVCCAGVCCAEGECCVNDQCTACESCSNVVSPGSTESLDCACYVRAMVEFGCEEIPDGWSNDDSWTGSPPRIVTPWALTEKVCLPGNAAYDAAVAGATAAIAAVLATGCAAVGGVQTRLRHCCDSVCQDTACDAPP